MDSSLLIAVIAGIVILLFLILKLKLQAFISLLISSIVVGVIAGMPPMDIINTMKDGMGNTLGFVAVVVGLGAMFGAILEHSGGAEAISAFLLKLFGEKGASWALMITGFIVAIPVFFDVAFIILVPIIYSLQRKSGKSLLLYAIPLLAGLAITHAFIPPTPGPVAVADILKADLGWVIIIGALTGIPTAIVCGPIFGKYIAKRITVIAPELIVDNNGTNHKNLPSVSSIAIIIALPIVLIVVNTLIASGAAGNWVGESVKNWLKMIGHPFSALILANLIAWYSLGIRRGVSRSNLMKISSASMGPAGIIILLTGAGGVFKEMLINTGTGDMLANYFAEMGLPVLIFAFVAAVLVRVLQGSATVAMITAAGVTAPLLSPETPAIDLAILVIAIAAGASATSHVNDSGFWLVSKYLGLSEKETFRSWTIMTSLLAIAGFLTVGLLSLVL